MNSFLTRCIQASVNVLDAKAEENARTVAGTQSDVVGSQTVEAKSTDVAEPAAVTEPVTPQPLDATKIQEPIPLPASSFTRKQSNRRVRHDS